MASPFTIFRRHQKALIASLGILTILAFVFIPPFMEYLGTRSGRDPVAVKTSKYGSLRQSQLGYMVAQRGRLLGVLGDALVEIGVRPEVARQVIEQQFGPTTEKGVVDNWLLSQRAAELGVVVSNSGITAFLKELTENRLETKKLQGIIERHGFSELQFLNALRPELMARELTRMFMVSTAATTPAQRWDYYSRLKRQATIEAVAVPVAKYAVEVADPSEATLRKFFDEHKDEFDVPGSPTPGFREPHRVDVQFFKVNFADFEDKVTDDEIKEEYEKNKETWDRLEKQWDSTRPAVPKRSSETPEGTKPGGEKPAGEKPAGEKPAGEKPAKEGPSLEPPAAKEPAKEKPAEEKPDAEKPAAEPAEKGGPEKASDAKTPDTKTPDDKGSSSAVPPSPFHLVALLQDKGEKVEPSPPDAPAADSESEKPAKDEPGDKPADKPASDKAEPPAAETRPGEKPAGEKPAEEKPAAEKPAGAAPAGEVPTETPETPTGKTPSEEKAKPEEKTKPEEKAKPVEKPDPTGLSAALKSRVRSEVAQKKLDAVIGKLQKIMREYYTDLSVKAANTRPPVRPDFEALAKENALTAGETGVISEFTVRRHEIGRTFVGRNETFADAVFRQNLPLFRSMLSFDMLGRDRYLFWKTRDEKERVLDFDDAGVRDRVQRAWKMIEARSLAEAEAKRLADEACGAKRPLPDVFRDRPQLPVIEAGPFSWMTFGSVPDLLTMAPPEMSPVAGVDDPGAEFMRAVFDLAPGEIGVAMNHPKTVAYVVRVVQVDPSDAALWKLFESDMKSGLYPRYGVLAESDRRAAQRQWLDEIKTAAGLKWEHLPEQRGEQQPVEE